MPDSQDNIKAFWGIEALHDIEADKLHFLLGMRKQNGKKKKKVRNIRKKTERTLVPLRELQHPNVSQCVHLLRSDDT